MRRPDQLREFLRDEPPTPERPEKAPIKPRARSPEFVRHWAEHQVTYCTYGDKRFHHPAVGGFTLHWETFAPTADPDLYLVVYTPPTGSASAERLAALR